MKIEYRVRKIERFIVTRWQEDEEPNPAKKLNVGSAQIGEYSDNHTAFAVAYALCKNEHQQLGYPPLDERIQYPQPVCEDGISARPTT